MEERRTKRRLLMYSPRNIPELYFCLPLNWIRVLRGLAVTGATHISNIEKVVTRPRHYSTINRIVHQLSKYYLVLKSPYAIPTKGNPHVQAYTYGLSFYGLLIVLYSYHRDFEVEETQISRSKRVPSGNGRFLSSIPCLYYKSKITGKMVGEEIDCLAKKYTHYLELFFKKWDYFNTLGVLDGIKYLLIVASPLLTLFHEIEPRTSKLYEQTREPCSSLDEFSITGKKEEYVNYIMEIAITVPPPTVSRKLLSVFVGDKDLKNVIMEIMKEKLIMVQLLKDVLGVPPGSLEMEMSE